MSERHTIDAGAEIQVGAPKQPLPQPIELALRDVVQAEADVAFACVPVIAFPGQPAGEVLVLFLRRGVDPAAALDKLSPLVQQAIERALRGEPKMRAPELALLPISLGRPLDGLAQAVVQSDTVLHVADVAAWETAKKPPRPLWLRILWPWGR